MAADWEAMRLEYAATDISLRELAKKYGVPLRTLADHSKKEDWTGKRQQHHNDLATAVSEAVVAQQAMDYSEYIKLSEQATVLGAKIFAGMREADLIRNPIKYMQLMNGLDKAEQLFRRTHGLDNAQQTQQIQITITPPEGEELTEQDMGV